MANFDLNKKYSIELTHNQVNAIGVLLRPMGYSRVYDSLNIFNTHRTLDTNGSKGGKETIHFDQTHLLDMEEDKHIDSILKNQMALGTLFCKLLWSPVINENKDRKITLNALLMYELYLTIMGNVLRCESNSTVADIPGIKNNDNYIRKHKNEYITISDIMYKAIGLQDVRLLKDVYSNLSLEEHFKYCTKKED